MEARLDLARTAKKGLLIAAFGVASLAVLLPTPSSSISTDFHDAVHVDNTDTPVITLDLSTPRLMPHTPMLQRIESDLWNAVQTLQFPIRHERFNPFPGTQLSAEDESRMSDGALYTPAGGRAFCHGHGWYLVRSDEGKPDHSLIGIAPSNLATWSRQLLPSDIKALPVENATFKATWADTTEKLAAFVALHEMAHGYMRKEMRFFDFTNMHRSPGQKTLIREMYGDIAALNVMLIYYPKNEVLDFADRFAAYRHARATSDPRHDTSGAITQWIDQQRAWRRRPQMTLAESYGISMRTFRSYIPGALPEVEAKSGPASCPAPTQRTQPVPMLQSAAADPMPAP